MKTVTASDTNRLFFPILRAVSRGEAVMIVSRGTTVAQIIPARPASGLESAPTHESPRAFGPYVVAARTSATVTIRVMGSSGDSSSPRRR